MSRLTLQFFAALALTAASLVAYGADPSRSQSAPVEVGGIEISGGWVRAMLPGQPAGGGFLAIANTGEGDDRLTAAASPLAGKVEIHSMEMVDGVMIMRPVADGLNVPAGQTVELKPGGLHLMLMGVTAPFADGATVPVTLTFEKAGAVTVDLPVLKAAPAAHSSHGG